ncbi:MAG: hypothetical protein PHS44_05865 [Candidatus Dojkabacteria bacterium]|nr:hypothetical protein [Candidatus Dojkabacteria bacterium]
MESSHLLDYTTERLLRWEGLVAAYLKAKCYMHMYGPDAIIEVTTDDGITESAKISTVTASLEIQMRANGLGWAVNSTIN